jgi:hypothetical protein
MCPHVSIFPQSESLLRGCILEWFYLFCMYLPSYGFSSPKWYMFEGSLLSNAWHARVWGSHMVLRCHYRPHIGLSHVLETYFRTFTQYTIYRLPAL